MLQEPEHQMEGASTTSPDTMAVQHSILSSYIIKPEELNI